MRIFRVVLAIASMEEMITSTTHISISEKGKRKKNEDVYYPLNGEVGENLFFVCDGIGGHGDGDLAAAFVQLQLPEIIAKQNTFSKAAIEASLIETNASLMRYAHQVGNLHMGCTVAVLQLEDDSAIIAWVGDSRVYHIRGEEILFKTKDHTLFELMLENEELSPEEALNFPMKHVIYQALGPKNNSLKASIESVENVLPGDMFLLVTDGVLEAWDEKDLVKSIHNGGLKSVDEIKSRCALLSKDNYTFTLVAV